VSTSTYVWHLWSGNRLTLLLRFSEIKVEVCFKIDRVLMAYLDYFSEVVFYHEFVQNLFYWLFSGTKKHSIFWIDPYYKSSGFSFLN